MPRFGETVMSVPVTIAAFKMVQQQIGLIWGGGPARFHTR